LEVTTSTAVAPPVRRRMVILGRFISSRAILAIIPGCAASLIVNWINLTIYDGQKITSYERMGWRKISVVGCRGEGLGCAGCRAEKGESSVESAQLVAMRRANYSAEWVPNLGVRALEHEAFG